MATYATFTTKYNYKKWKSHITSKNFTSLFKIKITTDLSVADITIV